MTSFTDEEISRRLSHTLDCLGYCPQMVQIRKDLLKISTELFNSTSKIFRMKTAGSKGEGIAKVFESDLDILAFVQDVLIVEDFINTDYIPAYVSVFRMVPCLVHLGHSKLLLI